MRKFIRQAQEIAMKGQASYIYVINLAPSFFSISLHRTVISTITATGVRLCSGRFLLNHKAIIERWSSNHAPSNSCVHHLSDYFISASTEEKTIKRKNGGMGPVTVKHKIHGDEHTSRKNLVWRSLEEALEEKETWWKGWMNWKWDHWWSTSQGYLFVSYWLC